MRHFSLFRFVAGGMACMLAFVAVCLVASSCVDDTFDKYRKDTSGLLTFDVRVAGGWTGGLSRGATAVDVRRMSQSGDGEPLYLVTEVSEAAADTVAADAVTRGAPVASVDDFPSEFGLSAICYVGEWEGNENKWTTNFAHNLKVSKSGGEWIPESKLSWMGSGDIKFFAYSPYFPDASGTEEKPVVSHSSSDDKGVPVLTYTVPEDVTEQPDLMTAVTDCKGSQGGAVELSFKHVLTAVTIKTGDKMLKGTIKKVTLSNVYGEGTYPIGADAWTMQGTQRSFEVEVVKSGDTADASGEETEGRAGNSIYENEGTPVVEGDYTFMMVPQTLPDDAQLVVEFTDDLTGTDRILTANLGGKTWAMGTKVTYSINSTGIVIEPVVKWEIDRTNTLFPNGGLKRLENSQQLNGLYGDEMSDAEKYAYLPVSGYLPAVKIDAKVRVTQEGAETKEKELPYVLQYSTDKTNWQPVPPKDIERGRICLSAQPVFDGLRTKLLGTSPVTSSAEAPYDLVKNNPYQKESANCYLVHTPGYYKFPASYGNTYRTEDNSERAYTYQPKAGTETDMKQYILENFVGHDDFPIKDKISSTSPFIPNIKDAVLVWQDSPELVTDVELQEDGWIRFRILGETINPGNAVIAVRDEKGTILWSWHIWVTDHYWTDENLQTTSRTNEEGMNFRFAPCNLGYCDPHEGNDERTVYLRFLVTMPDGTTQVMTEFQPENRVGVPVPDAEGVFAFTQPEIVASVAGDNTYYQWGRKDPMLPGVYNETILGQNPGTVDVTYNGRTIGMKYEEELDMENKVFYSTETYRFTSMDSKGMSIGMSIQNPHKFCIHERPATNTTDDKQYPNESFLRRHWHDGGSSAYGKTTIMNFWNSRLDKNGVINEDKIPNNEYVVKTIYDPSPAGFKVPPPSAFSALGSGKDAPNLEKTGYGWTVTDEGNGTEFFFPSTGLRDVGLYQVPWDYGTWPAHSKVAFMASSGFHYNTDGKGSCLLFYIDIRSGGTNKNGIKGTLNQTKDTHNGYGFTLRPVRDHQHAGN